MLKVFICEDQREQREKITKLVENTILIEELDMAIELSTDNPYKILEKLEEKTSIGLYFLDIDLGYEINGLQLAERIRKIDSRAFIVFITTHSEMSYLTFMYKLEAMDFIIKDNSSELKNRVHTCIIEAVKRHQVDNNGENKIFTAKVGDKLISIEYKNIMFFETAEVIHKVKLHSENRLIEFYGKMKELEKTLNENFIRCHNSYIVNSLNIKEIDVPNKILKMKNGEECYISSRGMKLIKAHTNIKIYRK
ncbi:MAG: LytR/AlgR family response regulator transcription factor [Sarcina sp.]